MVNEKFGRFDAKIENTSSGSKQEKTWDTARYSQTHGSSSPLEELLGGYWKKTLSSDSSAITDKRVQDLQKFMQEGVTVFMMQESRERYSTLMKQYQDRVDGNKAEARSLTQAHLSKEQELGRALDVGSPEITEVPTTTSTQADQSEGDFFSKVRSAEHKDTREAFRNRYTNRVSEYDRNYTVETYIYGNRCYMSTINRDRGHIIIHAAYRNVDESKKSGALPYSEILWHQYHLAVSENTGRAPNEMVFASNTPPITSIEHRNVTNSETLTAINTHVQGYEMKTFPFGSAGYNNLIHTPNCRGIAYLTEQHQEPLGGNSNSRIGVTHIIAGWQRVTSMSSPQHAVILGIGVLPT